MQSSDSLIYFDNAATSWPKPPAVLQRMAHFMEGVGGSPGRSGHRLSIDAARLVYEAREAVSELFGMDDPLRVVFCKNVTEAINLTLSGLLRPGDHVITSSIEHNSVMRPLRALERGGVKLTVVPCSPRGEWDVAAVEKAIRPTTRMIVVNHASNVAGTLSPVGEIGRVTRSRGLLLVVDAAQTGGSFPVHVIDQQVDILCFTGHKGLLGPQGTGGLVMGHRVPLDRFEPLMRGGTGSLSEQEAQPAFLPDKFESGTQNAVGLAGLNAAVRFILDVGVDQIRRHEVALTEHLLSGLTTMDGVVVYGPGNARRQTATVGFNIAGMSPADVGLRLDEEHAVLCRVGLHCSPATHRTLGTFPDGCVRFGLGYFNRLDEVDRALSAVATLASLATRRKEATVSLRR